ncbi:hypothetical protein EAH89_22930 [Roseomonas nepalensis]|uniref:Uncharacterized protein n=1 Tax=Muricoccus nepalensis TaxID=1854500 RepID=A0A502FFN7_9PROT|nr:hypothetical protein [Roseomonas nepalensis]TPG48159.1 hypothetical protein EAH89_22930 [Roseomonas nepalensis]
MPPRPALAVLLAALALVAAIQPAAAQLRSVVVPAEGAVIIPPRSAPRLAARPASSGVSIPPSRTGQPVMLPDTGMGLAGPVVGVLLPALAGALLGGSVAGSRGGTSGPARTR